MKSKEQRHDPVVVLLGNKLAACYPVIDDRVVFFQQPLELTKLLSGELREASIGECAEQKISLLRTAVPSAESELATERFERLAIVRHLESR